MEVGDAFSYGAICTTTGLLFLAVEIISPNHLPWNARYKRCLRVATPVFGQALNDGVTIAALKGDVLETSRLVLV